MRSSAPTSPRVIRNTWALLLLAALPVIGTAQSMDNPLAEDANQQHVAREMVEVLKAYAAYKTGDFEEAFSRYRSLADRGSVQGMLNLANMYAAGEGVSQNDEKAVQWYRRAADTGDTNAMYQLARAYEQGRGVEPSLDTAQTWYERAAEHDNAEAQWVLGKRLYARGDELEGLEWIRTAAWDGNDPEAQAFLARHGEERDEGGTQPSAEQIAAVMQALSAIDKAAAARDAEAIVAHISNDARIRVRLPGGPGWTDLSRVEFRTLWQDTFDRSENYHYERLSPDLFAADQGILAYSQVEERFGNDAKARTLEVHESAVFDIDDGRAMIRRLRLDIRNN